MFAKKIVEEQVLRTSEYKSGPMTERNLINDDKHEPNYFKDDA